MSVLGPAASAQPWTCASPLAEGTTLIEASAGTGKTYSIADLVVRLVVEQGVPIERILVVTFTRAATAELVDRVRARLRCARRVLADGAAAPVDGALMQTLAGWAPGRRGQALEKIALAWRDFPKATISTIHGFCQRMLQANAFATRTDLGATLVPDQTSLREQVAADVVSSVTHPLTEAQRYQLSLPSLVDFSRGGVTRLTHISVGSPDAVLLPAAPPERPMIPEEIPKSGEPLETLASRLRSWTAHAVRVRVEQAHARAGEMGYHDLLRQLALSLDDELQPDGRTDGPVSQALRARYHAVVIDEFQDTDSLQWSIFGRVFGDGARHLVLIGDPKQAIYGFRGANVDVYLAAKESVAPARRFTLGTSWRSDPGLVAALNSLFGHAELDPGAPPLTAFDHPAIDYLPVAGHHPRRLSPQRADLAPLEVRFFDARLQPGAEAPGVIEAKHANQLLPRRVAQDIVEFLSADPPHTLPAGADGAADGGADGGAASSSSVRPVAPDDIAVLVRTGWQAEKVREALQAAGVPAVIGGAGSVFATESAKHLLAWLQAVERPASAGRTRAAAVTPIVGFLGDDLIAQQAGDEAVDARWDAWTRRLRDHRTLLESRGFTAAFESLLVDEQPWHPADPAAGIERLMAWPTGERLVTDLQHLGALIQDAQRRAHLGVTGLVGWLSARVAAADAEREDDVAGHTPAPRRLERDSAAVRVATVHSSKGLEYPIVYVPWSWRGERGPDTRSALTGDGVSGPKTLDLRHYKDAAKEPVKGLLVNASKREARRLFYVAMTRARHRCVLYYGAAGTHANMGTSGSALMLQGERPKAGLAESAVRRFVEATPEATMTLCGPPSSQRWSAPPATELAPPRTWQRAGFDSWRMHSYSSMAGGQHQPWLAADEQALEVAPEELVSLDGLPQFEEPAEPLDPAPDEAPPAPDTVLLDSTVRGGRKLGNALHSSLEHLDFLAVRDAADDPARTSLIRQVSDPQLVTFGFDPTTLGEKVAIGLLAALRTPLAAAGSPLDRQLGAMRLWDVPSRHRLNELSFDLPLPDRPADRARVAEYSASLPLENLKGWLYGEIDMVMRDGAGRFWVVDYKSNRVGPPGEPLTPETYSPAALRDYVAETSYRRQYTLYTLALHRFLKVRQAGYDGSEAAYEQYVGGALYLFLRGMTGPEWPGHGVFHDRVPFEELVRLEGLLG